MTAMQMIGDKAFSPGIFSVILFLLVFSTLVSTAMTTALFLSGAVAREIAGYLTLLLFGLSVLGSVAGYTGGLSRETAVPQIIPAVLALAGSASAYLFGIDRSRGAIASLSVIAFGVALLFGFMFGADIRSDVERNQEMREACYKLFFDPALYETQVSATIAAQTGLAFTCQSFWAAR